jgi:MFS family permease
MSSIRLIINKANLRKAAPAILLVFNSFVWYIITYPIFANAVTGLKLSGAANIEIFSSYFVSLAITAIVGSKYLPRVRNKALCLWPLLGGVATLCIGALSSQNVLINTLIAVFLGSSVGIGLPSCLSYFAESTSIETRGFVGGLTWGGVGITVVLFAFFLLALGNWEAFVALAIWRLAGAVIFSILKRNHEKPQSDQKSPSYLELIQKREILLYFVPWTMFSLVNFVEIPILSKVFGATTFAFVQTAEFGIAGLFAVIGGIIADIQGRKRVIISGFILLGIEYAALSLFSLGTPGIADSTPMLYVYLILDGATWGLLLSMFFTTIWGDLGGNQIKEKYYALGGLPYLLSNFLSIIIMPYADKIPFGLAFTFASFFLFMAVIPLMYASETLPEKTMKDRDLKSYAEKALKQARKENDKKKGNESDKAEPETEEDKEDDQQPPGYDEARKLAEKYY